MLAGRPTELDYIRYSPIVDRPPVKWPDGARVALWLAPNLEFYEYQPARNRYADQWPRTPHPDVMSYSYRDSGNRTGFWRMLEVFDHHAIRATVSTNVAVLEHFPELRDAMVVRDWDFMSHGTYNTRYLFGMSAAEEREFYKLTSEVIKRQTGKTLKGMLGPAFTATATTPELMAEAGLIYQVDWFIDDQPFPIVVRNGTLVGVPYSRLLNDALLFSSPGFEGDYFGQICKDQFDVLYAEGEHSGRVMCIALHPYLIGQPHRIRYLDEVLDYILGHEGVWRTTADEIAAWYIAHHRAEHLSAARSVIRTA
jgi:peptidoglycan/xylan/chitin deacetylase (PgdA/CDA1 family)